MLCLRIHPAVRSCNNACRLAVLVLALPLQVVTLDPPRMVSSAFVRLFAACMLTQLSLASLQTTVAVVAFLLLVAEATEVRVTRLAMTLALLAATPRVTTMAHLAAIHTAAVVVIPTVLHAAPTPTRAARHATTLLAVETTLPRAATTAAVEATMRRVALRADTMMRPLRVAHTTTPRPRAATTMELVVVVHTTLPRLRPADDRRDTREVPRLDDAPNTLVSTLGFQHLDSFSNPTLSTLDSNCGAR